MRTCLSGSVARCASAKCHTHGDVLSACIPILLLTGGNRVNGGYRDSVLSVSSGSFFDRGYAVIRTRKMQKTETVFADDIRYDFDISPFSSYLDERMLVGFGGRPYSTD